ncbi:MAG: DUF4349 domain-containing protein, partial [Calditrichaeota bacterium]|nr:DUF4349 domain-containing protein [Calditrichota bacterium]
MRLIALIFSLFCFSCAADNDQTRPVEIESPETSGFAVARNAKARTSRMLDFQATESVQEQSIEQKQIKNANLVLKVNKLDGIEESVKTISAGLDSHITNTNTFATNFRRNMSLTIRVKADQFDQLLNKLEALAEYTESKNSSIRDVTEQFIDIEARLKNQKAAEQQ